MNSESLQTALEDIIALRKTITAYNANKNSQISESTFSANIVIQSFTLLLCLIQISVELSFNNFITRTMIEKNSEQFYRVLGVTCIGSVLLLCLATLYFLVWKAAQQSGEELSAYIRRNFVYLQNLSTVSDLFIKFAVISMLIFIQQPSLVSPFLFLFLGDYLIQGRYFTIPVQISMYLAVVAFLSGFAQIYWGNTMVIWPLCLFGIANFISLLRLLKMKRVEL